MFEADLVASRAAVLHLLDPSGAADEQMLYPPRQDGAAPGGDVFWDRIGRLLVETGQEVSRRTSRVWSSEPSDQAARVADFVAAARGSGEALWPRARSLIAERLSLSSGSDAAWLSAEALGRAVDSAFFADVGVGPAVVVQNPQRAPVGPLDPTVADVHVHVGGAVPWDVQWWLVMTGRYPLWAYARADTRLVDRTKRELVRLLSRAVRLRRGLAERYGPRDRLDEPCFDALLFARLHGIGRPALEEDDEVRDYVLVRSLARREMLAGDVRSLDEFTASAWKRFWGKQPDRRIGGPMWLVLGKRVERVDRTKLAAAAGAVLPTARALLRANPDDTPRQVATQCRLYGDVLKPYGARLVLHGRIPEPGDGEKKQRERLRRWELALDTIKTVDRDRAVVAELDLAGPERNTPVWWLREAVQATAWASMSDACEPERRITVHAGEDFYDPWQALARIMVVLDELEGLRVERFRIGHGSVLGIDPYELKWGRAFRCPIWARLEALDQAVGLGRREAVLGPDLLRSLREKRAKVGRVWELRGGADAKARDELGWLETEVEVDRDEVAAFRLVQGWVAERVRRAGVTVESNPTSNLRILGAPSFAWVPFWGLRGRGLRVALGSDDPGLMSTCIEEECARLRRAWRERLSLEDRRKGEGRDDDCALLRLVEDTEDELVARGVAAREARTSAEAKVWADIEVEVRRVTLEEVIR